jgi:hypothetical protein
MGRALRSSILGTAVLIAAGRASAGGWAIGSDQTQIKGWTVVEVGEVQKHSKLSENFLRIEWYEFNGRCFRPRGYTFSEVPEYSSEAALLLQDQSKTAHQLALLKVVVDKVEIKVTDVEWIMCPSTF